MGSFYDIIEKIPHILKGNCVLGTLGYFLKQGVPPPPPKKKESILDPVLHVK